MTPLAALDVGTNSFHLVIARVGDGGHFEVTTREKELVRLGHGGGDMKRLDQDSIDRGIAALTRMRRLAESAGAPLRAVATSAVREAENAREFLDAARERAGVEIEVISGLEEARLIHLGILQAIPVFDKRLILCDIGGGSTEILVGERGEVLAARSFKLGAVRLTDRFFAGGDDVSLTAVRACQTFIRSALAVYQRDVAAHGFEVAVGSSGTAETIARIAHALRQGGELRTYNRAVITRADLRAVVHRLTKTATSAQRRKIPGIDPDRADIIVAGSLILEGVFDTFGIDEMVFSDYALREGVLLDTIQRSAGGTLHHLRDVSLRSVRHLADMCDEDPEHSEHVAKLAVDLFDRLRPLHRLDEPAREYLEAGGLLANVGLFISHSKHHLHSYYVIRNSEVLTGFTDSEIEIIALLARYHRKSAPKASHPDFTRLTLEQQHIVRVLSGILRVAIGLDRSHDRRVHSVGARQIGDQLTVEVTAVDGADIALELYASNERSALLSEVLGLTVTVAEIPVAPR
jgi:exopolyphosphatase / guanosine-5'-triphosphate,3'-diphosphate pyrophosphatase